MKNMCYDKINYQDSLVQTILKRKGPLLRGWFGISMDHKEKNTPAQEKKSGAENAKSSLTPRQLQARRTKDRIYQSALRIIAQTGYKDASIDAITKEAGVSIGSFYKYFSSKDSLLLHSFVKSGEVYQQAYREVSHLGFPENLYLFVRLSYFALEQRGKEVMYGVTSNMLSPEFKERVIAPDRAFFGYMRQLVQTGKTAGRLRDSVPTEDYVKRLFTMLTGVEMIWCLTDFQQSLSSMAEASVRDLMEGMLCREPLPDHSEEGEG